VLSEDFPAQLTGFRAGSLVAGYRLEAQVGAGGMAVVFRACDQRLGRLVALKILAPALAADSAFRRRFIAESRAAAAVDDPHIIPIYEAGEARGGLFIAMRFVTGGDLRRVLEQEGPLPPGRAAGFISPVASALDAAHRAGLVHRDVKPANILVDASPDRPDHVYLSDFGVSKGATASVSLTGTGQFLGTPDYSAPEQIRGLAVDGRTDQYALACVAYQLLTGEVPFERDQGMAVLLAHLSEPPPSLGSRRPDLPEAAGQVLARALAKAPEKRYRSCRDFAEALREALGLAPYHLRGPASAPDYPPTQPVPPTPGFPGSADPATTATLDDAAAAVGARLAALDPATTNSDALASTPREQITGRQEAERAAAGAQHPAVEPLTQTGGLPRATGGVQGLTPAGQAGAVPVAGPARSPGGVDHRAASKAGDDHHPSIADVSEPNPGEGTISAPSPRLADVAGPDAGTAPPQDGASRPSTSPQREDHPGPESEAGEKRPRAPRPRRHGIRRRTVIIAAALGAAVIGLVIPVIIISSAPGCVARCRWSYTTGDDEGTSPAVADGTVYADSGGGDKVYALDAATGHVRWAYTTADLVNSSPAVADGTVYVADNSNLYALDAATGSLRWSYAVLGTQSTPAVAGGTVYLSSSMQVYALDAATGHVRWSYTTTSYLSTSSPTVADGTVYVAGGLTDKVYALDAATGSLRWSYPTGGEVDSSPAVAGGTVYIGSDDRNVYALDAATGSLRWSYPTGSSYVSSPAVAGGTVYIGSDKVYALDAATGSLRWSYPTGGTYDSSPVVAGGTVYIGIADDKLYALSAGS
jgi:eukaryotic-like serine/threonine-protein kinase